MHDDATAKWKTRSGSVSRFFVNNCHGGNSYEHTHENFKAFRGDRLSCWRPAIGGANFDGDNHGELHDGRLHERGWPVLRRDHTLLPVLAGMHPAGVAVEGGRDAARLRGCPRSTLPVQRHVDRAPMIDFRSLRWPVFLALTIAIVMGCDREADSGETGAARHSDNQTFVLTGEYTDEIGVSDDEPLLGMPAFVRWSGSGALWTLDTASGSIVGFSAELEPIARFGEPGRGPGQLAQPNGLDAGSGEVVWVSDYGTGKVIGWSGDDVLSEFNTGIVPTGVIGVSPDTVWVFGDLQQSLFVSFDSHGQEAGAIGRPILPDAPGFRLNQGSASTGQSCTAVWAYLYHSVLECYQRDGTLTWRTEGPTEVRPAEDADPFSMMPGERFAYTDVSVDGGRVYALFVGSAPVEPYGISTDEVHVYAESSGEFLGRLQLPERGDHLAVRDRRFALLRADPIPRVALYDLTDSKP